MLTYLLTTRSARSYQQHLPSIDGENRGSERCTCPATVKSFWNNYLERKKLKMPLCKGGHSRKVGKDSHRLLLGLSLSGGLCSSVLFFLFI